MLLVKNVCMINVQNLSPKILRGAIKFSFMKEHKPSTVESPSSSQML